MGVEVGETTRLLYGQPFDSGRYVVTGTPVTLTPRVATPGVSLLIAKSGGYLLTGAIAGLVSTHLAESGVYVLTGY